MSYSLRKREPVADGMRRLLVEQVERAAAECRVPTLSPSEKIHQVRRRCKKVRAALRLIRGRHPDLYRRENARYRDLAACLAPARDADIIAETLTRLASDVLESEGLASVQDLLRASQGKTDRQSADRLLAQAQRELLAQPVQIACWPLETCGFDLLREGLETTYRRARRGWKICRGPDPAPDALFHEWRKRVKYHWHHTSILRNTCKPILNARIRQLAELANILGEYQDLSVLKGFLASAPDCPIPPILAHRMEQQRQTLTRQALHTGALLLIESPKALRKRIEGYWHEWRTAER